VKPTVAQPLKKFPVRARWVQPTLDWNPKEPKGSLLCSHEPIYSYPELCPSSVIVRFSKHSSVVLSKPCLGNLLPPKSVAGRGGDILRFKTSWLTYSRDWMTQTHGWVSIRLPLTNEPLTLSLAVPYDFHLLYPSQLLTVWRCKTKINCYYYYHIGKVSYFLSSFTEY
jgi:hypothetical protein